MRVLSISTLFPNPARPLFGIFVGNQMRAVAARPDVELTMISPLGIPPWPLSNREPYARMKAIPDQTEILGLSVHYPRFATIPMIGGDGNPARIVRAVLPLVRRLHREEPFDLVDASFFFPDGPAAARIAGDLGLPLAIKSRGADIHYWGARPNALKQMRAAANQADILLAVSEALKADMAALGMAEERIRVHYTGLDREKFRITPRDEARTAIARDPTMAIPEDGALLVTPGALIPRKGQRFAIEALTAIKGARLAIAGAGEDEAELRRLVTELGLTDRVRFLGLVTHDLLPTLLSAADAVVLPSASEGLANVWVESLACGAPLVIPDIGGARELVRSPSAGRIAPRDAAEIANAIANLLADPPAQEDVAANVAEFSWDRNAERIAALWAEAASRYAGSR